MGGFPRPSPQRLGLGCALQLGIEAGTEAGGPPDSAPWKWGVHCGPATRCPRARHPRFLRATVSRWNREPGEHVSSKSKPSALSPPALPPSPFSPHHHPTYHHHPQPISTAHTRTSSQACLLPHSRPKRRREFRRERGAHGENRPGRRKRGLGSALDFAAAPALCWRKGALTQCSHGGWLGGQLPPSFASKDPLQRPRGSHVGSSQKCGFQRGSFRRMN